MSGSRPTAAHGPHEVAQHGRAPLPAPVDHHRRRQVAQQPGAVRLQRLQVPLLEEQVGHQVAPPRVREGHEERPVQQPAALRQLRQRRVRPRLDGRLHRAQLRERALPVLHQHLAGELAPQRREPPVAGRRLGEREVGPQLPAGGPVVAALELELRVGVVRLQRRRPHLILLFQNFGVEFVLGFQFLD